MKKSEVSQKKASPNKHALKVQAKISSFFSKENNTCKSEENSSDDDVVFVAATPPTKNKKRKKESPEMHEDFSRVRKLSKQDENINIDGERKEKKLDKKKSVKEKSPLSEKQIQNIKKTSIFKDSCDNKSMSTFYGLDFDETKTLNSNKSIEKSVSVSTSVGISSTQSSEWDSLLDEDDDFFDDWATKPELLLDDFQRCIVTDIIKEQKKQILSVRDEKDEAKSKIHCLGFWKDVAIEQNDIVSIKAEKENGCWIIDNNKGFLVVKPDALISITTVVGSLFCPRKSVLTEKFRRMESLPYYKSDDGIAVIGKLVHQLLQDALCREITSQKDIYDIAEEIMKSRDTAASLYACDMTWKKCREEIRNFVPLIFDFLQHYMKGKIRKDIDSVQTNFKGQISKIRDIEENIWLPKLGLKGKIDVTAEVTIHSRKRIMPLELKTGKTSYSFEHKGQIILYIMMMALTGQEVDTGLLLYIRNNSMQEIKSKHSDRRDLIILRNTLANYFSPRSLEKILEIEKPTDLPLLELPEPISHNFCGRCLYNTLCCTYMSKDEGKKIPETLIEVSKTVLEKLDSAHIDYVVKWVGLLELEEQAQSAENRTKDLWTLKPEKREKRGTCIANLKLQNTIQQESRFLHNFRLNDPAFGDFSSETIANFAEDEYVIISTDTRTNIAAGHIVQLKNHAIELLLDRDLSTFSESVFHIDKHFYSNINMSNYANLAGLLNDDETCERLRRIVIDKKPATFEKGIDKGKVRRIAKFLQGLNEDQTRAILKALTAKEYMLIKGMPGTGKTQTLVALILALNQLGHSILITAHTNSAVDNILLKLVEKEASFLRLGSSISIHPSLKLYSEAYVTSKCTTPESLEEVYKNKNIVGVTCYGAHHALLGKRIFDYCIIDESAQVMQPTILRPLFNAKVFILAGDPDQLPPVIRSATARKLGADETLFERLDRDGNTMLLGKQYRMNQSIMYLANKLTYCDKLSAANENINSSTFTVNDEGNLLESEIWQQKVLSNTLEEAVIVLDTGCTCGLRRTESFVEKYSQDQKMYSNIWEAAVILQLCETLIEMSVEPEKIGVIAPYRLQVLLLKKILHSNIEVNTVDQYQGRDKDIIFYSCARSFEKQPPPDKIDLKQEKKRDSEILEDHRRLTVAITRAKYKLIVVADKDSIVQYTPFQKLFEIVGQKRIIKLKEGSHGFSWKSVTSSL